MGAIAWTMACLVGSLPLEATANASPAQVVHVSTQYAAIGQLIHVTGSGWSPVGQTVQIELCGQNARNLSSDCAQDNQYTAAIRAGGIFYGALTVRLPPSPCPCVVLVSSQSGFTAVRAPITIFSAPTSTIPPQTAHPPVALSATILTPVSVSGWFGGPKAVTLVLRVTNTSSIAYGSPTLTVNVGRGANPNGFVVGRPLAPLAVGATHVLRIPVTLPAFTYGHYSVRARVITGNGTVSMVVATSTYPWGLFVVGIIVLLAAGLLLWRHMRRRRDGRLPRSGPSEGPCRSEPVPKPLEAART
jgi:hypothetical protein